MDRHVLIQADARRIPLRNNSVHAVVSSPPYWGLRNYGVDGQIGLEATPDEYVATMVEVFREVRHVLRADGTCWLNLGDTYATKPMGASSTHDPRWAGGRNRSEGHRCNRTNKPGDIGLKHKDLIGIPWRVALALQADGWWLRSDIIWEKPNAMPSSVTDRPSNSHEYLFLLTKSANYFYDIDATREPVTSSGGASFGKQKIDVKGTGAQSRRLNAPEDRNHPLGRNKRTVWTVPTVAFDGAHFAMFAPKLIEPCIKAGTSERGCCPSCGSPWVRQTESSYVTRGNDKTNGPRSIERKRIEHGTAGYAVRLEKRVNTVGWAASCSCDAGGPVPCVVLDPFNGAGTTGLVSRFLGRSYIGLDLSRPYLEMSAARIEEGLRPVSRLDGVSVKPLEGQASLFGMED